MRENEAVDSIFGLAFENVAIFFEEELKLLLQSGFVLGLCGQFASEAAYGGLVDAV
jgi:hypothetical protein